MHTDLPVALVATVQQLMRTYSWGLLNEAALCQQVWQAASTHATGGAWEVQITGVYATLLHTSCAQTVDPRQRAQAYTELHRYLYYNACQRYPHLSPEDLAQGALQLVYQQLDRCHTPGAFFTFALFKLLQVAKEAQRHDQRQRTEAPLADILAEALVSSAASPLALTEQEERAHLLHEALARLPDPRQRQVIQLKFFDELNDEEIGQQLALTANHVRVLRNRGLQHLRKQPALRAYIE